MPQEEQPLYRYWLRIEAPSITVRRPPEVFPLGMSVLHVNELFYPNAPVLGDDSQAILHEEVSIGRNKENSAIIRSAKTALPLT